MSTFTLRNSPGARPPTLLKVREKFDASANPTRTAIRSSVTGDRLADANRLAAAGERRTGRALHRPEI